MLLRPARDHGCAFQMRSYFGRFWLVKDAAERPRRLSPEEQRGALAMHRLLADGDCMQPWEIGLELDASPEEVARIKRILTRELHVPLERLPRRGCDRLAIIRDGDGGQINWRKIKAAKALPRNQELLLEVQLASGRRFDEGGPRTNPSRAKTLKRRLLRA